MFKLTQKITFSGVYCEFSKCYCVSICFNSKVSYDSIFREL